MNVQDVIEKALAGNDGIPVTPVEHSSCENVQVEKLASALNFIGANLESSFDEFEKEAAKGKNKRRKAAQAAQAAAGAGAAEAAADATNAIGTIPKAPSAAPSAAKPSFFKRHSKALKYGGGALALGGLTAYGVKKYRDSKNEQNKTASVDDALYRAAQFGKQALLEKVAEDRINPAKISAGSAAPYSGEIMPKGENVFGGQTMPAQLVAMKAQKVRARINSDMKKFVNNVGDGYNLQGHLSKMNK